MVETQGSIVPPTTEGESRRGRRRPLLVAASGAAAVVVIGAILVAAGVAHFGGGSGSGGVDTAPITFPATLLGFKDYSTVYVHGLGPHGETKVQKQVVAGISKSAQETISGYGQAYGGAGAGAREYTNGDLSKSVVVIGVRAASPGLTDGLVIDPAAEDQNAPERQVVAVGPVSCEVDDELPALAGTPVKQSTLDTVECQRSGPALTVWTFGGDFTGLGGRKTMVALTNQAWAVASKS